MLHVYICTHIRIDWFSFAVVCVVRFAFAFKKLVRGFSSHQFSMWSAHAWHIDWPLLARVSAFISFCSLIYLKWSQSSAILRLYFIMSSKLCELWFSNKNNKNELIYPSISSTDDSILSKVFIWLWNFLWFAYFEALFWGAATGFTCMEMAPLFVSSPKKKQLVYRGQWFV